MYRFRSQAAHALIAAVVFAASPTKAHAADPPSSAAINQARERFAEGRRLEEAGRFSEALVLFENVGRVKMTPQVRFHIALCLMHTGKHADALKQFRTATEEARTTAPNVVAEAKEHIATLEKRVATLTVITPANESLAVVTLEGREIAKGAAIEVDPGEYAVALRQNGAVMDERRIKLVAGEKLQIQLSRSPDLPMVGAKRVSSRLEWVEQARSARGSSRSCAPSVSRRSKLHVHR